MTEPEDTSISIVCDAKRNVSPELNIIGPDVGGEVDPVAPSIKKKDALVGPVGPVGPGGPVGPVGPTA